MGRGDVYWSIPSAMPTTFRRVARESFKRGDGEWNDVSVMHEGKAPSPCISFWTFTSSHPSSNAPCTRNNMASTHHFHAHKLFNVKGFVAIITGGGTGIGLMSAQALAANG